MAAAALASGCRAASSPARATLPGTSGAPSLPTAAQLRDDISRMVGFGPRFTGSKAHDRLIGWMVGELRAAGCTMLPYDLVPFERWLAEEWGLEILDGPDAGPVPVTSYYPYGGETPAGGTVGALVHLGGPPSLPMAPQTTPMDLEAALLAYPGHFEAWLVATLASLGRSLDGTIVVIEIGQPLDLTEGLLATLVGGDSMQWPDPWWVLRNYKRLWTVFELVPDLLTAHGAAGAVYALDASQDAARGNYAPFGQSYKGFPALFVDRDTGSRLAAAAAGTPNVRFTMTASKAQVTSPSIVGVLPGDGSTDEVIVLNTHTDGVNFAEENGCIALVHLARYFGDPALPASRRLRRSLVLSGVTGHFGPNLPQTQGFVDRHPDLVQRAAAALTLEHFGCPEWWDDASGYHATGEPEVVIAYHGTAPAMKDAVLSSVQRHHLRHMGTAPAGPFYFGVGGALQEAGIPECSFLAGPNYLTSTGAVSPADGHLAKLDADLAAAQVAWAADLLLRLDRTPAAMLRSGQLPLPFVL